MSEQARDDLKAIVDLLGPNMWLQLDDVAMRRYFGDNAAVFETAAVFSQAQHCAFTFSPETGSGRFGRAYYKQGNDAG